MQAIIPLPGKAMAVVPGRVTVKANPFTTPTGRPVGSLSNIIDRNINPGYPFWIAGMEHTVGQRPPTPVLDMVTPNLVNALKATKDPLWNNLDAAQADGFDGGLPRHTLHGVAAGGVAHTTTTPIDFSKEILVARPEYFPEQGTDVEQTAMRFHAVRNHPSFKVPLTGPRTAVAANFVTNGSGGPAVGAPFHEPCIDDTGVRLNTGVIGTFFSGETLTGMSTRGSSIFSAQTPRVIKGSVIQFDAVLNKVGYHYPQQRIITLWQDALPVINKQQPPEPLVFRMNTFDCAVYSHTNLVPKDYELDDFQVRTPTDVIGQHIHLVKWDLTSSDGAANGWNYEDGTFSPGAVRERIDAIRAFNACTATDARNDTPRLPGGATASVLRAVQPARLAGRPHHHGALVRRPGGQHRGRGPRPGHHLHARPLRPLDPPADRPVRDAPHRARGLALEAERNRSAAGLRPGDRRPGAHRHAIHGWWAARHVQRRRSDLLAGGDSAAGSSPRRQHGEVRDPGGVPRVL